MHTIKEIIGSFLMISLLLLTSCGDKSAKVSADLEVTSSMAIEGLNMAGGAVIAGETTDQVNSFVRTFLPGEDFTVIMEQGVWNFSIITYSGEEGMLSGDIECGVLNKVEINADTDAVKVTVNSSNCSDAGLRGLKLRSCTSDSYANVDPEVIDSSYCGGGSGGDSEHLGSLRLTYLDHTNLKELGDSIQSRCLSKDDFEAYNLAFLTGEGVIKKVLSKFELYKTDDCSGRSRTIVFEPSMANHNMPLRLHYIAKGDGLRAFIAFNTEGTILNMENLNSAPILSTPYEHLLAQKLQLISLDDGAEHFTDPNGDEMSYSCYYDLIVNGSLDQVESEYKSCDELNGSLAAFNIESGKLFWTPGTGAEDSYEIIIKASDGEEVTEAYFAVNLMSADDTKNPNTEELAVWLQAKESYLYQDTDLTGLAASGSTPLAWRNTIPNGSNPHAVATTVSNQAPTLEPDPDSLMTEGKLALSFKSSSKTYFEFPDGDYGDGEEGTIIIYASNNSGATSGVYFLLSKKDSPVNRTYEFYQNASQNLHNLIVDTDTTAVNFGATDGDIRGTSFCTAMTVGSGIGQYFHNYFATSDTGQIISQKSMPGLYDSAGSLIIGNYNTSYTGGWDGSISEVLIWRRTLSNDEVAAECTRLKEYYGITL